ncbi:MAG TPA: glycosyltransferase family 2 protein [Opitutaceae bacterium]|nr:glycosyltransferase family 2 protein [Opitutaceae bacterium]
MATPLVSILIPCHNAAPWLAETLESALAQTWPHREIIVVDDGSNDHSVDLARTFASRGVQVVGQENRGASAARNHALRLSRGDYLQFLDADDLLAPDKLAQQMKLAAATAGTDVVLCGTWSRFTRTPADADFTPQPLSADAAPIDWLVTKFEQNAMMHPAAWLTPRALAERAGPWDESLSLDDDGEYFTRVVLASYGVRCCREAVTYYRSGLPGSLSGTRSERAWTSAFRSLELSSGRLLAREDTPRTRQACATAFQHYIYDSYPRAAECRRRATAKVAALGGSTLLPPGGPKYRWARRLLGWRLAKRLQQWC